MKSETDQGLVWAMLRLATSRVFSIMGDGFSAAAEPSQVAPKVARREALDRS